MNFVKTKWNKFFLNNFNWTTKNIIQSAFFIALWPILGYFTLPLRILDIHIPFFYFLIWFIGFIFRPYQAFVISFLGHLLFDLFLLFSPFYIFIWLVTGLSAMFISLLNKNSKSLVLCIFLLPFLYICGFFILSVAIFNKNFFFFFTVYPHITIALIIVNPIFNFFVFWSFKKNKALKNLIILGKKETFYSLKQ